MAQRPALREVWRIRDPHAKLRLYAGFVRGVHERLAFLFTQLTIGRGWPSSSYQDWLTDILAATLLDTP